MSARLGDAIIAVAKFSSVIRNEVATSVGLDPRNVLELDRFCIHPSYHQRNFASWMISRSVREVFSSFPDVRALVSFSDMTYGHVGTIYRATNWRELGLVRPDYFYVDGSGFIMHKKTLYNRAVRMGMTESEYAEKYGYSKTMGREKVKFIMERPKKAR